MFCRGRKAFSHRGEGKADRTGCPQWAQETLDQVPSGRFSNRTWSRDVGAELGCWWVQPFPCCVSRDPEHQGQVSDGVMVGQMVRRKIIAKRICDRPHHLWLHVDYRHLQTYSPVLVWFSLSQVLEPRLFLVRTWPAICPKEKSEHLNYSIKTPNKNHQDYFKITVVKWVFSSHRIYMYGIYLPLFTYKFSLICMGKYTIFT